MKFFILIHSVSSFVCLKKLIEKGYAPDLVIAHENYEREKFKKKFFIPLAKFCKLQKIRLIKSDNPDELKDLIKDYQVGFCVGYMKILRKEFFEIPKYGIFNLHCGKLPEYRGRAPISRTIMNGDKDLIATLHKIDEGVDSGPIAIETKIKITVNDDVNTLYKKFSDNSYKSIIELLKKLKSGKIRLRKQKKFKGKAYTTLSEDECRIDWGRNQIDVFNKIRALKYPYPCAFSLLDSEKYLFGDAGMTRQTSKGKPGTIEAIKKNSLYINTKDNLINVTELSSNNKKINIVKQFNIGEKFI